jgi:hypothetical protein
MTRDFNKQRRDDARPSFRDRSSNNNGEERSPSQPARPRLNRETVDRAWESGAQHKHADYRARTNNGQPPRNNWRSQQPSEYSSSQNGHGGNRPFNNRQENYRDNPRSFERTSDDPNGPRNPRPRSFGPNTTNRQPYDNARPGERRPYDNARPGERRPYDNARPGERRPYDNARPGERRPYDNARPGERRPYDNARPGERRPYDNARPGERRPYDNARPGERRPYDNRSDNRDERSQGQDRGRDNRRPDFQRNERPSFSNNRRGPEEQYSPRPTPDTRNPRWQSRTWTRREASPEEQQEHSSRASYNEQFEGDYERFNNKEERPAPRDTPTPHRASRPEANTFRGKPRPNEEDERHVTRLPDGRVIKGPRPLQRQEARFWTEVKDDTDSLVGNIQIEMKDVDTTQNVAVDATQNVDVDAPAPDASAPDVEIDASAPETDTEGKPSKKPRTRSASATVRSRKTGDTKEKVRGVKGPRPSQRGYKWPTT